MPNEPEEEKSIEEMQRELFNSEATIEQNFFKNLRAKGKNVPAINSMEDLAWATTEKAEHDPSLYEEALMTLTGIRDDLIQRFEVIANDASLADFFTECIHKVEASVSLLGGSVETFNPLEHMSGFGGQLQEELLVNANRVVENTRKSYKLFSIGAVEAAIFKEQPSVKMLVRLADNQSVTIQVVAKEDFSGNEAIDYVRRDGEDIVSVRALQRGNWADVSGRFQIVWRDDQTKEVKSR